MAHDLVLYTAAIQRLRDSGRFGRGEAFSRWLETDEGVRNVQRLIDHDEDLLRELNADDSG